MEFAKGGIVLGPGKVFLNGRFFGNVTAPKRKSKGFRKHIRGTKAAKRQRLQQPIRMRLNYGSGPGPGIFRPGALAAIAGKFLGACVAGIEVAAEKYAIASGFASYEDAVKRHSEMIAERRATIAAFIGQPLSPIDAKSPCGECHLKPGETCDICGASAPAGEPAGAGPGSREETKRPGPADTRARRQI